MQVSRQPEPEKPLCILHLEDSLQDHELICKALKKSGLSFEIIRVESKKNFFDELKNGRFDVILADYRLSDFTAVDIWHDLTEPDRQTPFVLLTGAIGETAAVEAIKLGISDYLLKDDLIRLDYVIRRAIEVAEVRAAKQKALAELQTSEKRLADFSSHLQDTIELERASIAREIHDDIGGSLAALRFDLAWLSRHTSDATALQHISLANEMLQHALGASQRIMMNLRPAILDQGIEAAIEWLLKDFEVRHSIKTSFRSDLLKPNTNKNILLVAYRTTQEALTNISKYARCSQVTVDLTDAEAVLTLEIKDNGTGIKPIELEKPGSFGLKGLRERARTVGGWLDVSSICGDGTSIILSVPLTNAIDNLETP